MVKRGIPVLMPYFQRVDSLIWPRFHELFSANVASVKSVQVAPNSLDMRPHYVVRRYAEFATSLLSLTTDFKHPDVIASLNTLREDMTALLDRLAMAVQVDSAREKTRRQQVRSSEEEWVGGSSLRKQIFLLSNLDLILSLLRDKEIVSTETVMFEDKMETIIADFVEAELMTYFQVWCVLLLTGAHSPLDPASARVCSRHCQPRFH